jgi:murein DD-endopeptidase MepM/ murein hydrolase activator NlpD
VINDGWPSLTTGRKILLGLALCGLVYLFLQTRTAPVQISSWNANPFAANSAGALSQPQTGIVAEAAPQTGRGIADTDIPSIDPLGSAKTIMTQGYGVGSHAPANVWGAVDLAIDGDGDGQPDPKGTLGMPVYATHDGVVQVSSNTWPAGNHIWLTGVHFKTGYSHLLSFAVQDGQSVKRGEVIGYVGATGEASGPHLDYQVWKDGVNVNPLDYGALAQ